MAALLFIVPVVAIGLSLRVLRYLKERNPNRVKEPEQPITIIFGALGSGKTLLATMYVLRALDDIKSEFKQFAANIPIRHPSKGLVRRLEKDACRDDSKPIFDTLGIVDEAYEWWRTENFQDVDVKEQRFIRTARQRGNHFYLLYQDIESAPPWLRRLCHDYILVESTKLPTGRILWITAKHFRSEEAVKAYQRDRDSSRIKESERYINWPGYNRFKRAFGAYDTHYYRTKLENKIRAAGQDVEPIVLPGWDENGKD